MLSKVAALSSLPAGSLTTAGVRQQKIIENTQRQHDVKDKHKSNVKTNTLSLGGSQKLQPLANRPQRSTNNASTSYKSRPLFESKLAGKSILNWYLITFLSQNTSLSSKGINGWMLITEDCRGNTLNKQLLLINNNNYSGKRTALTSYGWKHFEFTWFEREEVSPLCLSPLRCTSATLPLSFLLPCCYSIIWSENLSGI